MKVILCVVSFALILGVLTHQVLTVISIFNHATRRKSLHMACVICCCWRRTAQRFNGEVDWKVPSLSHTSNLQCVSENDCVFIADFSLISVQWEISASFLLDFVVYNTFSAFRHKIFISFLSPPSRFDSNAELVVDDTMNRSLTDWLSIVTSNLVLFCIELFSLFFSA